MLYCKNPTSGFANNPPCKSKELAAPASPRPFPPNTPRLAPAPKHPCPPSQQTDDACVDEERRVRHGAHSCAGHQRHGPGARHGDRARARPRRHYGGPGATRHGDRARARCRRHYGACTRRVPSWLACVCVCALTPCLCGWWRSLPQRRRPRLRPEPGTRCWLPTLRCVRAGVCVCVRACARACVRVHAHAYSVRLCVCV